MSKTLFSLAKTPLGDLIVGVVFGKLSGLLPVKKLKDTKKVIAFWHPKPFWQQHILIVPKRAIRDLASLREDDLPYITEAHTIAQEIVKELGWEDDYFLLTNGGKRQEVHQIHFHLGRGETL